MAEQSLPMAEHTMAISFSKFPPNISLLSSAGFDSISSSKKSVVLRKTESIDLSGRQHLFTEIQLDRNEAKLRYSVPKECDVRARRLHAAVLFLRTLSLVSNAQTDSQSLCAIMLPSLEHAEKAITLPYELLSKKHMESETQLFEANAKLRCLVLASEGCAQRCVELEKQNSSIRARASKLESVSDAALCESILDWLSIHRGTFSIAHFSNEHAIPPSRCEEGLELLLKSGAIRKAGGRYALGAEPANEHFTTVRHDPLRFVKNTANDASRRFSAWISHKE